MRDILDLCHEVRRTAYAIHKYHGHGHMEKVYENALAHRLRLCCIKVEQQHPLRVFDEDGTPLGDYFADLLVDERLIVEVKAARAVGNEHVAQLLGYLRSADMRHGMVINFGTYKFEIRKLVLDGHPERQSQLARLAFAALVLFVFFCGQSLFR